MSNDKMNYKLAYKPIGFSIDRDTGEEIQGIDGTLFIPAYQRGYRWTPLEVQKLLDDVAEAEKTKAPRYSLQPVVVKKRNTDDWELIDGQQRLTTLWLIFNYMHKAGYTSGATYRLEYETRSSSQAYLQTLDVQQSENNIDYFHLRAAHDTIESWFLRKTSHDQARRILVNRIHDYLCESVHVIWYEVPETENPIALFTRLNQGRIPLTDAELLKAVLLTYVATNHKGREAEIAAQWDGMERDLQRPEIWAFVAGDARNNERYGTRISLLFDTLAQRENPDGNRALPYFTFDTLRTRAEEQGLALWREIVALHAQILGWFEEPRRYYNKIGFLVNCGVPIGDIQRSALKGKKSAFDDWLTGEIRNQLNIKADDLNEDLRYDNPKHGSQLQRLLLLFNVEICRDARFPFDKHAHQDWTLEHIHAQNAQSLTRAEQWKDWLTEHQQALSVIETKDNVKEIQSLSAQIEAAIPAVQERDFNTLAARIQAALTPNDEGADHTIANLALLSHGANAALSNSVFEVKRQKVVEMDKCGQYIPTATRNVFLKYYTDASKLQPHFWGKADKDAYLDEIKKELKDYLQ